MDWVKLKAYEDGAFALRVMLERFEEDVREANALPVRVRKGRNFWMDREGDHGARIGRESHNGKATLLTLEVGDDDIVWCTGGPRSLTQPIRAVPNEETGEVRWLIDNPLLSEGERQPMPLWQLSRRLLGHCRANRDVSEPPTRSRSAERRAWAEGPVMRQ